MRHLPHINDLVFDGYESAKLAIQVFRDIVDEKAHITIKYDGSPAIVAGRLPDSRLFISTKSFFNKTPILYTSEKEIDSLEDKDLARKVKNVWNFGNLDLLEGEGIVVGDYMYDKTTLLNPMTSLPTGQSYSFTPNTLQYVVDFEVPYDVGVVWHTYLGNIKWKTPQNFLPLQIAFRGMQDVNKQNMDTTLQVISNLIDVNKEVLDFLGQNKNVGEIFQKYTNVLIREELPAEDPISMGEEFQMACEKHFDREKLKVKFDISKKKVDEQRQQVEAALYGYGQGASEVFKIYILLKELKLRMMMHLIPPPNIKVFLPDGSETSHEGCVVAGPNYRVKFVDQEVFTYWNFKKFEEKK